MVGGGGGLRRDMENNLFFLKQQQNASVNEKGFGIIGIKRFNLDLKLIPRPSKLNILVVSPTRTIRSMSNMVRIASFGPSSSLF